MAQTPARVRSGQRRHKVQLQQGVSVTDVIGGRTQTWDTYATDWAAITGTPLVINESQASVQYLVALRFRSDTLEKHLAGVQLQVVTDTKTLKVLEIVNTDERNRDLLLYCARPTT